MAKLYGCDLSKISLFGKKIDFYYWKGILIARSYPRKPRQPMTDAQVLTLEAMRYANREYNRLAPEERNAFSFLASPSQMSGRDLFLKIILENFQSLGETCWRSLLRLEPIDEDAVQVVFTKPAGTPALISGLTVEDKKKLLVWREITPTLRGKRLLRRWELYDHTEDARFCDFVPPEDTIYKVTLYRDSEIKYLTARAVLVSGGCYGRLGLYSIF